MEGARSALEYDNELEIWLANRYELIHLYFNFKAIVQQKTHESRNELNMNLVRAHGIKNLRLAITAKENKCNVFNGIWTKIVNFKRQTIGKSFLGSGINDCTQPAGNPNSRIIFRKGSNLNYPHCHFGWRFNRLDTFNVYLLVIQSSLKAKLQQQFKKQFLV